ncbi:hypothetical protein AGDE_00742 [Angomonas deanei]|uniref:RRM domain-containing protein n=1 Tax=Angomonas deanei TaxID=59799 RepID=S9WZ37_9TRYP|nr:hypothetical protein AGDE_09641 [Angomonas deanei]EPY35503.1 hypothetical protein AGDE_07281 [Angomonas deanei]EPY41385.1 hypothetical protein AGDE_02539 [Angomonas deanei]EPY43180.1 hypothetical protein AGDE_00742 [Angomonas deanei]CAD2221341.1 hypothetical protein, conserved [Angomonas deanei]|eukprot:EPY30043.1 hypothetical protein AGDE_09641 [Angomonas deanei]
MPLDLVGKLHRTIYITNVGADDVEDLVQLMLARCGAVEAWDYDGDRATVVFQSMNSMSTALAFDGMTFVDLSRRIVVWKASDPPPPEATSQLRISAPATTAPVDEAELEERRAVRRERVAALAELMDATKDAAKNSLEVDNAKKLDALCYRQLKALCVLTEFALAKKEKELESATAQEGGGLKRARPVS